MSHTYTWHQVYRDGAWSTKLTTDLLPGDLISLAPPRPPAATNAVAAAPAAAGAPGAAAATPEKPVAADSGIVPCDCVLLRGAAVVNEATLTGESVPQMKDALAADAIRDNTKFDLNGAHRVHTLFAGTSLIAASAGDEKVGGGRAAPSVARTPGGGCLCYVLRSGFSSAQGELMQLIEFSQQAVADDSRETLLALLVLTIFAFASSAYVFKKGIEKGDRTTHELLLKCASVRNVRTCTLTHVRSPATCVQVRDHPDERGAAPPADADGDGGQHRANGPPQSR